MKRILSALTVLLLAGCATLRPNASTDDFLTHRHNLRLSTAIQLVNTGSAPNAGNGDTLYAAFTKINGNTTIFQNMWGPSGLLRGNGAVPNAMTAAAYTDVVSLFTCATISSGYYLAPNGTCQVAAGSGTVTTTGSPATGQPAAFSSSTSITPMTFANLLTLFTGCGSPASNVFLNSLGACASGLGVSGTTGGIPWFSASSTLGSSAVLGLNLVVLGGGTASAPATLPAGLSNNVLHGNSTYGYVNVASGGDTTGVATGTNGGTGANNGSAVITVAGNVTQVGSSGITLTTTGATNATFPQGSYTLGYLGLPLTTGVQRTTSYTFALTDAATRLQMNCSAACTDTIPANSAVPFTVSNGVLVIENVCTSSQAVTIAITTDTLNWNPTGSSVQTGTRTLAPCNFATIVKETATSWVILPSPGIS